MGKQKITKTILTFSLVLILLLTILPNFVNAEVYLWNNVIKDDVKSVVKYHAYYWFDDTSLRGIGKQKDIPITLVYDIQALPYDLVGAGYWGEVDWCNLTITSYHNIYGTTFVAFQGFSGGELLNTTSDIQSYFFENAGFTTGKVVLNMRDKDSFTADVTCHYTDVRSLYVDNFLFGRFTTYMPSFECDGCSQYSLEELSQLTEKNEEITANELAIYSKVQTAVDWNYQIWLIISWVIKIGMVLVAIGLIFASVYFYYVFLKNLGKEM